MQSFADDLRGAAFISDARILIPSMYTEPSRFATVVAVGPMRWVPGTWWSVLKVLDQGDGEHKGNLLTREWAWLEGYYEPHSVKVGETVLCNRYPKSARPIIWQGQEFVIVDENEILARVEHAQS